MSESLFGNIVSRFTKSPENIATESLIYILDKSVLLKSASVRFIRNLSPQLPEITSLKTQVSAKDRTIPDIVGVDENLNEYLIIEAKFWAGLTENQPVKYLERLPDTHGAIFLFLAP